jgi:hypothetical protein
MPVVKPPKSPPTQFDATLGPAVGRCDDFYALGYCPELDEREKETNPDHTSFTFVLHYEKRKKTIVERVKSRLDDLWQPPSGPILAVGDPDAVFEIDAKGVREVALSKVPGAFMAIWGVDDRHVFACGIYEPFVFYRRQGKWLLLPLPKGTADLYDVCGMHENEVYFVGEKGTILLWDGQTMSRLAVPTTRYLTGIARLNDKLMCACGYDGTLLVGNKRGWRLVPTNVNDDLLAIADLDGKVYYGADDVVWSFDGISRPTKAIDTPADWVSGLADGLELDDGEKSRLYCGGKLVDLDTTL